jgi:hypothetical protein
MILFVAFFCLIGASSAAGNSGLEKNLQKSNAEYVDSFIECRRAESREEFLRRETERLESGTGAIPPVFQMLSESGDSETARAIVDLLAAKHRPIVSAFDKTIAELDANEKKLREQWISLRGKLKSERTALYEGRAARHTAGQLAFLLNVDNRWFWLCGLFAVAVLAAIVLHDRRHEIRRQLNGGKARAMGGAYLIYAFLFLMTGVTVALFVKGDWIYRSLLSLGANSATSPQREDEVQLEEIKQKLAAAKTAENVAREKCVAARKTATAWIANLSGSSPQNDLAAFRASARDSIETIVVGTKVQDALAKQIKSDADALEKVDAKLTDNSKEIEQNYYKRQWIRQGLGVGLLGLVAMGGGLFQWSVRRRREKIRDTCPQCLAEGAFEPVEDGTMLDMVQCKSLMSEETQEPCHFTMPEQYLDMPKICFPTLGNPSSGKTHWLAMTYRELKRDNYQDTIKFTKIRSSAAEQLDQKVEEILNLRIGMEATLEGDVNMIPGPLVFNFDDRDRLGQSSILVNIFDYSGEVARRQTLEHRQRRRALEGDGFLFFIDPTISSENQADILANFRSDLCLVKKVRPNSQLHIPVAVCVSKLDLLYKNPYVQGGTNGAIGDFYRGLADIGWNSTLPEIEARSKKVLSLRDTVWPGWQIERTLDKLFGGRYQFFPLTPVGLNGIGIEDLRNRVISPLGLLDPLLWLLHMNGYPVFK